MLQSTLRTASVAAKAGVRAFSVAAATKTAFRPEPHSADKLTSTNTRRVRLLISLGSGFGFVQALARFI
jgi:hypothetical protein